MKTIGEDSVFPASHDQTFGMTKREAFAKAAMQGILAANQLRLGQVLVSDEIRGEPASTVFAYASVAMADALIRALNDE